MRSPAARNCCSPRSSDRRRREPAARTPSATDNDTRNDGSAFVLKSLVRFSIRFRGIVIALAVLLAGYGIYTLTVARLDVFPEFAPPLAIVQTEAPGLSAEQVEVLVTQPIENALGGTLGVASMKSKSLPGLSMVTLTFTDTTDVERARQLTNERLGALAPSLPLGVRPPVLL